MPNQATYPKFRFYDVIIVGAGFAGLYALYKLRKLNLSARIYERGGGLGGTWYWNRYPGARCDLESLEYSYSFSEELQQEWDWSDRYGTQPEILEYANFVAKRFDLIKDIQFNTQITALKFSPDQSQWTISSSKDDDIKASIIILATGNLSIPQLPNIPGIKDFKGRCFHTGDWPHETVNFNKRRVGIIGTGSSGVQAIPIIAQQAAHLSVFQRTANFSIPAHHGPLDPKLRESHKRQYSKYRKDAYSSPIGISKYQRPIKSTFEVSEKERQEIYEAAWKHGGQAILFTFTDFLTNQKANKEAANFVRGKIRKVVEDPITAEILCPDDHPIGSKRLCLDTNYFETYNRKNVSLINIKSKPISKITSTSVVIEDKEHLIDDLVLATGFNAMTGAIKDIDIINGQGGSLSETWAKGPATYLGLMVATFPNLFLITGPQSPGVKSQMILSIEQHVNMISRIIAKMKKRNLATVTPSTEAQDEWVDHVAEVANATLAPEANSWYSGDNIPGKPRVFMPYVAGVDKYHQICEKIIKNSYQGFNFNA